MRRFLTLLLVMIAASVGMAQPQKPAPAEVLKNRADKSKAAADAAKPESCPEVCLTAARDLLELSNQYFVDGQVEPAQTLIQQAGSYAEKAGRISIQLRKRQKQTEIGMRRLAARMNDIMKSLNFEDRAPVGQVINSIEAVRADLLASMFGNPKKSFEVPDGKKEKK